MAAGNHRTPAKGNTMTRAILPALTIGLMLLTGCGPKAEAEGANATSAQPGLTHVPLSIQLDGGAGATHRFDIELALSEAEQEQGLMFRKELAPDGGMLFPFNPARPPSFWMKNTLIPLDMIFIGPDGRIAQISANRVPYSLEPASSGDPAIAVLEIPGDRARQLGIKVGDKVRWGNCPSINGNARGRLPEAWDRTSMCL